LCIQEVCKYLQTSLDGLDGTKTEPAFAIASAISKVSGCKAGALKPALKQVGMDGLFQGFNIRMECDDN
jgi:hypothetical protein